MNIQIIFQIFPMNKPDERLEAGHRSLCPCTLLSEPPEPFWFLSIHLLNHICLLLFSIFFKHTCLISDPPFLHLQFLKSDSSVPVQVGRVRDLVPKVGHDLRVTVVTEIIFHVIGYFIIACLLLFQQVMIF